MKPSFSIISFIGNSHQLLKECAENVRLRAEEAGCEIEHILINCGSKEPVVRQAEDFAKRFDHIQFISLPGILKPRAANEALKAASNQLVGWLETDERYNPDSFELVAKAFKQDSELQLLVGSHNLVLEDGTIPSGQNSHFTNPTDLVEFWKTWDKTLILPWRSTFYKRSLHDSLGPFFEQSEAFQYEFLLRVSKNYPIACIAERLTSYRENRITPKVIGVEAFLRASQLHWQILGNKTPFRYSRSASYHLTFPSVASLTSKLYDFWQRAIHKSQKVSRTKLAEQYNDRYFSKILKTEPIQVNPESEVEIHSVCGKRDLYMLILCLKSFLRYENNVRVVVHSDGSIGEELEAKLKQHIPGIEIFSAKANPDEFDELAPYDFNVYKAKGVYHHAKKEKVIMLDSDMIFLRKPTEIIDWMHGDEDIRLYGLDHYEHHSKYIEIKACTDLEELAPCFNAGLVCMFKQDLVKDEFLSLIRTFKNFSSVFFAEQVAFCFILSKYPYRSLPRNRYVHCYFPDPDIGADLISEDTAHLHFMGDKSNKVHSLYQTYADKVYQDLLETQSHSPSVGSKNTNAVPDYLNVPESPK